MKTVMSPSEYVTTLYKSLLGRSPEPEGLDFWVEQIADNSDYTSVLHGLICSEEFKTRSVLATATGASQSGGDQAAGSGSVALYDRMGFRLMLDSATIVDRNIIDSGVWEAQQTDYFFGLMSKFATRSTVIFLDLGSYWGLYSLLALRHGATEIHAFEADPYNFAQLKAQLFLNDATSSIKAHNIAVSNQSGVVNFWDSRSHPNGNRGGVGIVDELYDHMGLEVNVTIPVDAVPIDEYIDIREKCVFIKLDLEGHEHQALDGLKATVAENKVLMQVEILNDFTRDRIMPRILELGLRKIREIDLDFYYTNIDERELV